MRQIRDVLLCILVVGLPFFNTKAKNKQNIKTKIWKRIVSCQSHFKRNTTSARATWTRNNLAVFLRTFIFPNLTLLRWALVIYAALIILMLLDVAKTLIHEFLNSYFKRQTRHPPLSRKQSLTSLWRLSGRKIFEKTKTHKLAGVQMWTGKNCFRFFNFSFPGFLFSCLFSSSSWETFHVLFVRLWRNL